jgi:hypothetical protein
MIRRSGYERVTLFQNLGASWQVENSSDAIPNDARAIQWFLKLQPSQ